MPVESSWFAMNRTTQEPTLLQMTGNGVHPPPELKLLPPLKVLQAPSTASSGRRLIVVIFGASYGVLSTIDLDSVLIQPRLADS
jgi:hypothetical protein